MKWIFFMVNQQLDNSWQAQNIDEAFASVPPPTRTITSFPGATAILSQAWTIYKQRFPTFLGVTIIPMLTSIVLIAFFVGGFVGVMLLSSKFTAGRIIILIPLVILFFLIIFLSEAWGQTALIYAIKDRQEKIGIIESYRRGWHKIISSSWIFLLAGFITLGGFLLLIVPGIIFSVWFSLAVFILIAEDLKGMNALLKSREYVKGKWSSVFWSLLFIGVISFIIYLVPVLIFWFLKIPFDSKISRMIIGLFLNPLVVTYLFLVYSNLKTIKGEIAFEPTRGKKVAFIFIAILGILFIPAILLIYKSLL